MSQTRDGGRREDTYELATSRVDFGARRPGPGRDLPVAVCMRETASMRSNLAKTHSRLSSIDTAFKENTPSPVVLYKRSNSATVC